MLRFLFLFCVIIPGAASAQSPVLTDTITWVSASDKNLTTGDSFTRTFTFVTNASSTVDLVTTSRTRHFTISSSGGTWADLSQAGEIILTVTYNAGAGTIRIGRTDGASAPYLIVDMTAAAPQAMHAQFTIDHFTAN